MAAGVTLPQQFAMPDTDCFAEGRSTRTPKCSGSAFRPHIIHSSSLAAETVSIDECKSTRTLNIGNQSGQFRKLAWRKRLPDHRCGDSQSSGQLQVVHGATRKTRGFAHDKARFNSVFALWIVALHMSLEGIHGRPRKIEPRHVDGGEWRNHDTRHVQIVEPDHGHLTRDLHVRTVKLVQDSERGHIV